MVAKAEEVVAKLKSSDAATRLKAIRDIKNQIIGNKSRKKAFVKLSAIPRIVDLLAVGSESQFQIQCATVVGSLARLDKQSASELSQAGGITLLSEMLDSDDGSVVEAGLRALNFYFEAYLAKKEGKVNLPMSSLRRCSELLNSSNLQIRGQAARLVYYCAHDPSVKASLRDVGVISKLTGILESGLPDMVIHPAIMALCALPDGEDVQLQWSSACVAQLLKRIKTHPQAKIQLDCCTCITLMCVDHRCPESKEVLRKCLAVLARLITENQWPPYEFSAYSVLGALLKMEEGLVAPARDSGIVHALACRLASSNQEDLKVEVSLLNALATLIDGSEEGRKQLVDLVGDKAIQRVIKGMRSGDRATQMACFDVMRALSRSACYLRQLQARFRECAALCVPLLEPGTRVDMQVRACALLCNLVLGFSPARETALEAGCIEKLGQLVESKEAEVALHALWALGNVARLSVRAERFRVIDVLPEGSRFLELATRSPDQDIKIRAMVLLQNLTSDCSTAANLAALEKWLGMSGLLIPQALLEPDEHQSSLQLVPAVNAANNIINALQKHREVNGKDLAPLVDRLKPLLAHGSFEVVAGALWVVNSLVKGGSNWQASGECIRLLEEKQVWEIVSRLYDSTDQLDVKERAKTVLVLAGKMSEPDAMEED